MCAFDIVMEVECALCVCCFTMQIETMELANGVVVREHGRTKRGPTEVGAFSVWLHIILFLVYVPLLAHLVDHLSSFCSDLLCGASEIEP